MRHWLPQVLQKILRESEVALRGRDLYCTKRMVLRFYGDV